jgi:hypothetical protein
VLAALEDEFVETETGGAPSVVSDSVLLTLSAPPAIATLTVRCRCGTPSACPDVGRADDIGYGLLLLVGPERVGTILVHWPF